MKEYYYSLCEWLSVSSGYDAGDLFKQMCNTVSPDGLTVGEFVDITLEKDW